MKDYLERGLSALGIAPPVGAVEQLLCYAQRLVEQNEVMNLTAITEPLKIAELHFLDSAALLSLVDLDGKRLIDVGTGAGFPAVVLKILMPSLDVLLLDSLQKRLLWLDGLCAELGLAGISTLHSRAELGSRDPALREQFDFATARAVASLPMLTELCLPYVKVGGEFLAMKTGHEEAEMQATLPLLESMGGLVTSVQDYRLPESEVSRRLIRISKQIPTPASYPRSWSKIKQTKI